MNNYLRIFVVFCLLLFVFYFISQKEKNGNKIYLYAWETPQDFSFLATDDYYIENIGVAYLAGEVGSESGELTFRNRRNTLIIPEGIETISVVRINPLNELEDLVENKERIASFITSHCLRADFCQIDMDTKPSEYEHYKEIIEIVNSELEEKVSIAALASWCAKDSWLNNLNISYAVPMLYRMGEASTLLKTEGISLKNNFCKENVALSTDELDFDFHKYITDKNIFIFNPTTWTSESVDAINKELK